MERIDIFIRDERGLYTIYLSTRADVLAPLQTFEGVGVCLSDALAELSDQLAEAGL